MIIDFNLDGQRNVADLNLLFAAIRSNNDNDNAFDLNGDNQVDGSDRDFMVVSLLGSTFGDSNLDGVFNSNDLVLIFQAGQYEDNIPGNSTWETGDWNGDGDFSTSDLVFAFERSEYMRV